MGRRQGWLGCGLVSLSFSHQKFVDGELIFFFFMFQVRMVTGVYMACYWLWTLTRRPPRRVCVFVCVFVCMCVYVCMCEFARVGGF